MSNYTITVDTEKFNLKSKDVQALDIIPLKNSQYHLLQDNQSFRIEVVRTDFPNKNITISINGNTYSIQIEDEYDQIVAKMGMQSTQSHQINEVRSPMPGMIIEILASPGQEVNKGTPLIVLSAMKMENIITSPGYGVVKRIRTAINTAVEKGELIIEME